MEKYLLKLLDYFFMVLLWTSTYHLPFPVQGSDVDWLFIYIGKLKVVNENTGKNTSNRKFSLTRLIIILLWGDSFSFLLFTIENMNVGTLPENKKYEYYKVGIIGAELNILAGAVIWLKYMEENILWNGLNF